MATFPYRVSHRYHHYNSHDNNLLLIRHIIFGIIRDIRLQHIKFAVAGSMVSDKLLHTGDFI